jgi:hypothetical protein
MTKLSTCAQKVAFGPNATRMLRNVSGGGGDVMRALRRLSNIPTGYWGSGASKGLKATPEALSAVAASLRRAANSGAGDPTLQSRLLRWANQIESGRSVSQAGTSGARLREIMDMSGVKGASVKSGRISFSNAAAGVGGLASLGYLAVYLNEIKKRRAWEKALERQLAGQGDPRTVAIPEGSPVVISPVPSQASIDSFIEGQQ